MKIKKILLILSIIPLLLIIIIGYNYETMRKEVGDGSILNGKVVQNHYFLLLDNGSLQELSKEKWYEYKVLTYAMIFVSIWLIIALLYIVFFYCFPFVRRINESINPKDPFKRL